MLLRHSIQDCWFEKCSRCEGGDFVVENRRTGGSPETVGTWSRSFWRRPPTLREGVSNVASYRHSLLLIWEKLPLWQELRCCGKWEERWLAENVGKLEVDPFGSELQRYEIVSQMLLRNGIQDCWFEKCSRLEESDFVVENGEQSGSSKIVENWRWVILMETSNITKVFLKCCPGTAFFVFDLGNASVFERVTLL